MAEFAKNGFAAHQDYLMENLVRQLVMTASPETLTQIKLLLTIIGTGPGCLALSGHYGPFDTLDRSTRESILLGWASSPIALFRKAASGLKSAILLSYYRFLPDAWEATGYPAGMPNDWHSAQGVGPNLTKHYPYKFENDNLPFLGTNEEVFIDTEVLIIGSGSGGGVAAAQLSKKGLKCLVVDRGIYLRPEEMTGSESHGYRSMYDGEGILMGEDGHINVLAGSTFGGGSTINWSASLKPRN